MTVIGADRVMRKLSQLPAKVKADVDKATRTSGEELSRIAKVLIPVGPDKQRDGHERAKIKGHQNDDGSYLCDFGPKAKVIEGEGGGPQPFVNPALAVTRKKHAARAKRAVNKAVKAVMNG